LVVAGFSIFAGSTFSAATVGTALFALTGGSADGYTHIIFADFLVGTADV
jgi:hypothetical protein